MRKKLIIGIAVYVVFFAAVALSSGGGQTKTAALVMLSAGTAFWLGFSVHRITLWIRHQGRSPRRYRKTISNYPHWFAWFAFDEAGSGEKKRPVGLIDTV